jgi:hypothetical protein
MFTAGKNADVALKRHSPLQPAILKNAAGIREWFRATASCIDSVDVVMSDKHLYFDSSQLTAG